MDLVWWLWSDTALLPRAFYQDFDSHTGWWPHVAKVSLLLHETALAGNLIVALLIAKLFSDKI